MKSILTAVLMFVFVPNAIAQNGYPPYYYSGFVTRGLPTYLTSRHYPTIYGAYQYNGVMWAGGGGGMASVSQTPWSTYPNENYSPVSPPTEAVFGHNFRAVIDILVPADADVWIQDKKLPQSGRVRRFISPNLPLHQAYSYVITTSRIGRDGRSVMSRRQVIVSPGEYKQVRP